MFCKIKFKQWLLNIGILMFFVSCDVTLEPIAESEPLYSISGPLDIQSTPNFIRVHDITALLNPEMTSELDVQLIFTNLSTMESVLLQDSIKVYDNIYTHNFIINDPIEFDKRYMIEIEDKSGFRDSLITVTSRQTNLSISSDTVFSCSERFFIELTDIDIESGERLAAEVAVQVGNVWHWTSRSDFYEYNAEENILLVGWSPDSIAELLWPSGGIYCKYDFTDQEVRFRFTHIGYMEGEINPEDVGEIDFSPASFQQRNVLSIYGGEVRIYIDDEAFD